MPVITKSSYKPPLLFRNSYVNTIYPAVFRKQPLLEYSRERWTTPDEDFIDLDWSRVGSRQLVIVLHGLEGSSQSQYARGIAGYFNSKNLDALAVNHRSCSEEINLLPRSYHMGATEDISFIVNRIVEEGYYTEVNLVGFSLGGNITLKYLGEQGDKLPSIVKAAAAFSVPVDIPTANAQINRPKNSMYLRRFLISMKAKAMHKMQTMPDRFPVYQDFNPANFNEFDELITAPVHGFGSAKEYWEKTSSLQFIPNIKIPTLLVNAQDDTFLSRECFPKELASHHPYFHLETPKYGGHCGFYENDKEGFVWFEKRSYQFFRDHV